LRRGDLEEISVPVAPLDQQKRIVAEIEKQFSRLDEAVANLKRVKANLKRYKAAVLKAAVEGRLVETEAESTAFGRQNWKPIGLAICTLDQGWSPQCESEPAETDETWAVMKTTAVQPLRFSDEENKRLPPTLNSRANLELAAGDLLITRAGPRSRVGVTCLVKATRPHLMLCDKAYRLRVKPDIALPGFLEIVLNSPDVLYVLDELKTGISDSGLNLTQKRFKELLVPLPPLVEQQRVIAEVERNLSLADEAEAQVDANLQRADRLRQSILSRAFTGGNASSTIAHSTL
jgi:type I restriction enzyme, S subunit